MADSGDDLTRDKLLGDREKTMNARSKKIKELKRKAMQRGNVSLADADNLFAVVDDPPSPPSIIETIYESTKTCKEGIEYLMTTNIAIDERLIKAKENFEIEASTVETIHLKIQSSVLKKPKYIAIKKTDTFEMFFHKFAKEFKLDVAKIQLFFDGKPIMLGSTPNSMDIKYGDVIDLEIN